MGPGAKANGQYFSGSGANTARSENGDASSLVPPVPNWFQALKRGGPEAAHSPRFDEVSTTPGPTPRPVGAAGSHDQLATPRQEFGAPTPGASPRESPRPPEEVNAKSDEISYEGTYLGTLKHGTGRLRMNGCTYEGDFLLDAKHGNGILTWDDGRQYRGQFEGGKFHGAALMTWPDGRKYCGQYVEDRKDGEGTFSWQDGRRYQGQWVLGKRHGIGMYTNAKGLTRTGRWQMDRPLTWDVPPPPGPSAALSARREASDPPVQGGQDDTDLNSAREGPCPSSSRPPPVEPQQDPGDGQDQQDCRTAIV